MFLLFLIIVVFAVFLYSPRQVSPELVFNKPKVNIDVKFFDAEQFQDLEPFVKIPLQYSYKATTRDKLPKTKTGFISATSIGQARIDLEEKYNLNVLEIKEVEIGRDNPFTPYYVLPATLKNTATQKK